MGNEIWASIKGYEGLYEISNHGRVKALEKSWHTGKGGPASRPEKILTPNLSKFGYYHIKLWKVGIRFKWFQIHQLVAIAFLPNPESKPHVNHIDSVRTNNQVENLEWCTPKENLAHAIAKGRLKNINGKTVIDIITGTTFKSCKEAADTTGINYQTLRAYLNGALPNKTSLKYSYDRNQNTRPARPGLPC